MRLLVLTPSRTGTPEDLPELLDHSLKSIRKRFSVELVMASRVSCVALARNALLSLARPRLSSADAVLMIDDDMWVTGGHVAALLAELGDLRPERHPLLSARYVRRQEPDTLACSPAEPARSIGLYREMHGVGLGCTVCLPADLARVIDAAVVDRRLSFEGHPLRCVVSAGPHDGEWESEDYSLCRRWREVIGGRILLSPRVCVGHKCGDEIVIPLPAAEAA